MHILNIKEMYSGNSLKYITDTFSIENNNESNKLLELPKSIM